MIPIPDPNVPNPASFDEINKIFHALDVTLAKYIEDNREKVNPYEIFMALKCLEYKFETTQMHAFFAQTIEEILDKQKAEHDNKDQPQYR